MPAACPAGNRTAPNPAHQPRRRSEAERGADHHGRDGKRCESLVGASMAPRIAESAIDRTMADSIRAGSAPGSGRCRGKRPHQGGRHAGGAPQAANNGSMSEGQVHVRGSPRPCNSARGRRSSRRDQVALAHAEQRDVQRARSTAPPSAMNMKKRSSTKGNSSSSMRFITASPSRACRHALQRPTLPLWIA